MGGDEVRVSRAGLVAEHRPIGRTLYSACPLCDSERIGVHGHADCSTHPMWRKELPHTITWMLCQHCGHSFTDGYWTDAALDLIFGDTQQHQVVGADLEMQRLLAAKTIDRVLPYLDDGVPRHWLDVGFGNGALLFTAKEYGFLPIGLDLRESSTRALARRNVYAIHSRLEDLQLQASDDMVLSLMDVLEHTPFPRQVLAAAAKLMSPDSVLVVSSPNRDSELWRDWDSRQANPYWQEIEHHHNFTRDSLVRMLHQAGFSYQRYAIAERYRCGMEVIAVKR